MSKEAIEFIETVALFILIGFLFWVGSKYGDKL